MRHREALVLVVSLLAKRPDTLHTHLLLQERSNISLTLTTGQNEARFRLPASRYLEL